MGRSFGSVVVVPVLVIGLLAASAPPAAAASPKPSVSLSVTSGPAAIVDRAITFRGTTTRVPTRTAVQIQKRIGRTWRTAVVVRTGARGVFTGRIAASGIGRTLFRAHVAATKRFRTADSGARAVTVSRYFFLDELPGLLAGSGVSQGSASVRGSQFSHALVFDGHRVGTVLARQRWDVAGACTAFGAFADWADPAPTDPPDAFAVTVVDGVTVLGGSAKLGAGLVPVQADLTGAKGLELRAAPDIPAPKPGYEIALVNARVLCSKDLGGRPL